MEGAQRMDLATLAATIVTEALSDQQEQETTWKVSLSTGLQQTDGHNCGVFILLHLLMLAKTRRQTQNQEIFNPGRQQGAAPPPHWLETTRHLLLDALWAEGEQQVSMHEAIQGICRALHHAQATSYKEWQTTELTAERASHKLEAHAISQHARLYQVSGSSLVSTDRDLRPLGSW